MKRKMVRFIADHKQKLKKLLPKKQLLTPEVKTPGKNFANVKISTSFISQQTGNITHRWLSTLWNMANTLPLKFLRQ